MRRGILAVIVGVVVMVVWVTGTDILGAMVLGESFVVEEGATTATTKWSLVSVALGLVGAILGGLVAVAIGRSMTPVKGLAGLILVVGMGIAILQLTIGFDRSEPDGAPADTNEVEARSAVRPPHWYNFTLPIVGCLGVLIGGRMKGGSAASGVSAPDPGGV